MIGAIFRKAQNFGKDERGVVLVLFLVLLIPILLLIAIAIDFSEFLVMKRQLQGAVDSAALNLGTGSATLSTAQLNANALAIVQANLAPATSVGSLKASSQSPCGAAVCASYCGTGSVCVQASASFNTTFLRLAGFNSMIANVSATASQSTNYFDIYIAVDQSASLGIAATPTDRAALQAATQPYNGDPYEPAGCEFACHVSSDYLVKNMNWKPLPNNMGLYEFARSQGVSLRENVLNAAFSDFVSNVFTTNPSPNSHRRVDVIGFSDGILDLTNGPTSDQSAAASALSQFPDSQKWNTQYDQALPQILSLMGQQGNGSSQSAPIKMLVLITDGVDGVWKDSAYPIDMPVDHKTGTAQTPTTYCDDIKKKNFILAVIDIKYIDNSGDHWFDDWLGSQVNFASGSSTIYAKISPALQQCASPGWYFQANQVSDADGIRSALTQLVNQINGYSLRLSK